MKYLPSLLLIFCPFILIAQQIEGKVTDADTGEPVAFATVYFANTTIGTATDSEGNFTLSGFASGKYDLTISSVGFESVSYPLEVTQDTQQRFSIKLKQSVTRLPEIYVNADRSKWKENYELFKGHFLGRTEAASASEIANKDVLNFYYDESTRVFSAHASEPLEIVNDWLGYTLYFDMHLFTFSASNNRIEYYGIPRFEELKPRNQRTRKKWDRRRDEAYYGSVMHFFRSVYQRSFKEEQYYVQELKELPNPIRMPDSVIDKELAEIKLLFETELQNSQRDSLKKRVSFLRREARKPRTVFVPGTVFSTGQDFISQENVTGSGIYQVNFNGSKRKVGMFGELGYPKSTLYIKSPLRVYSNGYYEDIRNTYVEGDWSLFDTIATMLPLDFQPTGTMSPVP